MTHMHILPEAILRTVRAQILSETMATYDPIRFAVAPRKCKTLIHPRCYEEPETPSRFAFVHASI